MVSAYVFTIPAVCGVLPVQDIVERFQLLLVLCFVVVEDISNSGTWWPAAGTLLECGRIFIWEVRGQLNSLSAV